MNNYLNAMSLAFFQTYNVNNEDYRLYLNPFYTRHITEQSYIFSLLTFSQCQAEYSHGGGIPACLSKLEKLSIIKPDSIKSDRTITKSID
jgi:hypothetical protein